MVEIMTFSILRGLAVRVGSRLDFLENQNHPLVFDI